MIAATAALAASIPYDFLDERQGDDRLLSAMKGGDDVVSVRVPDETTPETVLSSKLGDWIAAVKRSSGRTALTCKLPKRRNLSRTPEIGQSALSPSGGAGLGDRSIYASSYNAYLFTAPGDAGDRVVRLIFTHERLGAMGCDDAFGTMRRSS